MPPCWRASSARGSSASTTTPDSRRLTLLADYWPGELERIHIDRPGVTVFPGDGQPDLSGLMAQAQQMQQQLLAAQEQLARTEVTGTAGGGLVTATVTGAGELTALVIEPTAIDPSDAEGLADLVLAAVRDANRAAVELQQQAMGPLAGGLGGLSLPGM